MTPTNFGRRAPSPRILLDNAPKLKFHGGTPVPCIDGLWEAVQDFRMQSKLSDSLRLATTSSIIPAPVSHLPVGAAGIPHSLTPVGVFDLLERTIREGHELLCTQMKSWNQADVKEFQTRFAALVKLVPTWREYAASVCEKPEIAQWFALETKKASKTVTLRSSDLKATKIVGLADFQSYWASVSSMREAEFLGAIYILEMGLRQLAEELNRPPAGLISGTRAASLREMIFLFSSTSAERIILGAFQSAHLLHALIRGKAVPLPTTRKTKAPKRGTPRRGAM